MVNHVTALNGYWERLRRGLQMLGGDQLPAGTMGVVIVGDSREPGNAVAAYRRFAAGFFDGTLIAVDYTRKYRFDADCVVTSLAISHTATATAKGDVRLMSPAEVVADAGAVYTTLSAQQGGWLDRPDGSNVPMSVATNTGTANVGRVILAESVNAAVFTELGDWLFMPAGSAICVRQPTNSVQNQVHNITCYTKY